MSYSRANPSPRYLELQAFYRELHEGGDPKLGVLPQETFPGFSLDPHVARIKRLIDVTGARTVLDYGSGMGMQYEPRSIVIPGSTSWNSVLDYWGVDEIACYDPGYPLFSMLPDGMFDGVVSTDVLEHCPEEDIPWIVAEIFGYAERFVFANIACYPALRHLPNGENVHCTIRSTEWWQVVFEEAARCRPGVQWEVWTKHQESGATERRFFEQRIGT